MSDAIDGVRRVYGRTADTYDRRWRRYLDATIPRTIGAAPPAGDAPVLDVGCGTGVLLRALLDQAPTRCVVGVDVSREMLDLARDRLGRAAGLVLADARALPFPDRAFATVYSSSVLHHWPEPVAVLREIARVLRPGGTLALTDWRAGHPPTRVRELALRVRDPSHHRAYGARAATRLMERAGLRVRSIERYRLGWSWGFMTIVAVVPNGRSHTID